MKYANKVSDIINAFSPAALKKEQMAEFYCKDTMEYRTSDKYSYQLKIFLIFVGVRKGIVHVCY